MRKILRKKFVLFAMITVTLVLAALTAAISWFSWILLNQQSAQLLHTLAMEREGFVPKPERPPYRPFAPVMDMDTLQSARFFTVQRSAEGEILSVDVSRISSVDREQAEQYANRISKNKGSIDGFRYEVREEFGGQSIFFLDLSGQKRVFILVLSVSVGIAALFWLLIFVFVVLFSGRMVRPLLANLEKQKQFITNAGHELKTPLAIIQSNNDASALLYGENKYHRNIRTQTKRLNALMSGLLTLAKLDEYSIQPAQKQNVSELTQAALAAYREPAEEKKLVLQEQITPELWLVVQKELFEQMLSALLDNAVKYTPRGGRLSLCLKREGKKLLLLEENTCEELSVEDPEQLFERFFRGDTARTQKETSSGYGIGLSSARAVCEALGGTLTAVVREKNTLCFRAELPIRR